MKNWWFYVKRWSVLWGILPCMVYCRHGQKADTTNAGQEGWPPKTEIQRTPEGAETLMVIPPVSAMPENRSVATHGTGQTGQAGHSSAMPPSEKKAPEDNRFIPPPGGSDQARLDSLKASYDKKKRKQR